MKTERLSTSAALYFDYDSLHSVPLSWLHRTCNLFADLNLRPILFTASDVDGETFLNDDCYVLAGEGFDIHKWGEQIKAREPELVEQLRKRRINGLSLDVPSANSKSRSEWLASADICIRGGTFYLGMAGHFETLPASILQRAFSISKEICDVRYAIAFTMPLADHPASYASGHRVTKFTGACEIIANLRNRRSRPKTADELWEQEISGQQRHLVGLFRSAYPANILSTAHVESADLLAHKIGILTQLDESRWLWELSESELRAAEKLLETQGVLVHQHPDARA